MSIEFYPQTLFALDQAYDYGVKVGEKLKKEIKGRACGKPHDYGIVAQTVFYAGDGNYAETGTLFGASALVAALTKRKFNLSGDVYCIDPLDGYYGKGKTDMSGILPTPAVVMENARRYGVESKIKCVAKKSVPYPKELDGIIFSCSYIDGDHWKDIPTLDWVNLSKVTSKFILFDNYDKVHPSVVQAAEFAVADPEWRVAHVSSISFVLQRNPKLVDKFFGTTG